MKHPILFVFALVSLCPTAKAVEKAPFAVFGKEKLFVEVTCYGLPGGESGQTFRVPSAGLDGQDFARRIAVVDTKTFDVSVSSKRVEDTLTLSMAVDGKFLVEAGTSGLDVSLSDGKTNVSCELNAGEQITDL
jgi:hypothetical protein